MPSVKVSKIRRVDAFNGNTIEELDELYLYPAKHFVVPQDMMGEVTERIRQELDIQLEALRSKGKILEAERLKTRTIYDMEMMKEMGYCSGIENYSAVIANRKPGEPPATLLHYFPDDFL